MRGKGRLSVLMSLHPYIYIYIGYLAYIEVLGSFRNHMRHLCLHLSYGFSPACFYSFQLRHFTILVERKKIKSRTFLGEIGTERICFIILFRIMRKNISLTPIRVGSTAFSYRIQTKIPRCKSSENQHLIHPFLFCFKHKERYDRK